MHPDDPPSSGAAGLLAAASGSLRGNDIVEKVNGNPVGSDDKRASTMIKETEARVEFTLLRSRTLFKSSSKGLGLSQVSLTAPLAAASETTPLVKTRLTSAPGRQSRPRVAAPQSPASKRAIGRAALASRCRCSLCRV